MGLPVADRDYVVVGATPEEMIRRGFKPVGRDFPVFLHPRTREEYALARTERKVARGYKGFTVYAAPEVTLEQDLARRDLTINAIAKDASGGLIDPLPVDLPREMGADKVIAVDVGRPFASPPLALLGGALKVVPGLREMGNLLDLMGQATTYSHPVPPDLILRPDLQGMGPNSIRRASINRAIAQGEACARAALPAIRSLAKSD